MSARLVSSVGSEGQPRPGLSPALGGFPKSAVFLGFRDSTMTLPPSSRSYLFPLGFCVSPRPWCKDSSHWIQSYPNPVWPHLS